jgi:3-oxoacyl-[acyl-carrier protein] reductase
MKVLITGGGRGLGYELVKRFVLDNHEVGILEKDKDSCIRLEKEFGQKVNVWSCDVTKTEEVAKSMGNAVDINFIPDILVNNAGVIHSEPIINITKLSERQHSFGNWQKVIEGNLYSTFIVTAAYLDIAINSRKKGIIICISSVCAKGNAGQTAYSAAKAGINSLVNTWSKELGPLGYRFVSIAPGFLDLESTRKSLTEDKLLMIKKNISLRKMGSAEDIYNAVTFAISNQYITGTTIEVDGGVKL